MGEYAYGIWIASAGKAGRWVVDGHGVIISSSSVGIIVAQFKNGDWEQTGEVRIINDNGLPMPDIYFRELES